MQIDHPLLSGIYEPVDDERDDAHLTVVGEIPPALTGTILRNGPNANVAPSGDYHLFDYGLFYLDVRTAVSLRVDAADTRYRE